MLKRSEYIRVQRHGKKLGTRSLLILVHPGVKGRTRLGIATSKKVGKAVVRNRIKRVIREVFRRNRELFPPSFDIVVIPKRGNHRIEYETVLKEITRISGKFESCAG